MKSEIRIGLVGDENPEVTAHRAIPLALKIAARQVGVSVNHEWLPTPRVQAILNNPKQAAYNALWCVPASPYQDTLGALFAINKCRIEKTPLLGSCGGFQHIAIEFAQSELGYTQADNAEINPQAEMPLIAPLSCSMAEVTGHIVFAHGSLIASHYNRNATDEKYHCNFGLNSQYSNIFNNSDLCISGVDENNDPRAIELKDHPFYIGVAFQPERSAMKDLPHPLITAFVQAATPTKKGLTNGI